ncbi:MAG: 50S ribosomal protein L31 [Legionellales bacterium]|nr:50S ribosomal protein L31 [Legionellales bacterium]
MQTEIHPKYIHVDLTCSCGNTFDSNWTSSKTEYHLEACSKCHPAYTKEKNTGSATGDRVDRFNKRFNRSAKG